MATTVTILYSSTNLYCFSLYNEQFDFSLTSLQAGQNLLPSDTPWYDSRIKLRVEIDSAKQAVALASDISNAQSALDRATYIRENQSLFF